MAGIIDDLEFRVGPRLGQLPGGVQGCAQVEPAVDEHAGDARQPVHVAQQLPVLQPGRVGEVMRADPDERQSRGVRLGAVLPCTARLLVRDHRVLPGAPPSRRRRTGRRVGAFHQSSISVDEVAVPVGERNAHAEGLPLLGQQPREVAVEPVDLLSPGHGDRGQHDLADPLGIALRVGEDQRRAPGTAVEQPAVDAEVFAQPFHVGDQMMGRVVRQVGRGVGGVREALAAATLIEQDDPVGRRVEHFARAALSAAARPAVHHQCWFTVRVTAGFPVDPLAVPDVQQSAGIRLDIGKGLRRIGSLVGHDRPRYRRAQPSVPRRENTLARGQVAHARRTLGAAHPGMRGVSSSFLRTTCSLAQAGAAGCAEVLSVGSPGGAACRAVSPGPVPAHDVFARSGGRCRVRRSSQRCEPRGRAVAVPYPTAPFSRRMCCARSGRQPRRREPGGGAPTYRWFLTPDAFNLIRRPGWPGPASGPRRAPGCAAKPTARRWRRCTRRPHPRARRPARRGHR